MFGFRFKCGARGARVLPFMRPVLGARPETIEPGGKEGRLGVAEGKRGGAQRVGLQWCPGPQVGRGLNDHYLAGWTPCSESELAIGGVEDIGNGQWLTQNCLHKPAGGVLISAHGIAAGAEGSVRWQGKPGQLPTACLSGRQARDAD